MLNNAFIIGADRCETRTLYKALSGHPRIAARSNKPTERARNRDRRKAYRSAFDITKNTRVTLDRPAGQARREVFRGLERLWSLNPDAKLIYLMRDPVARFELQVKHDLALTTLADSACWHETDAAGAAISSSEYYRQIGPFLNRFGSQHVLLGICERFTKRPAAFVEQALRFLGLEPADGAAAKIKQRFERNLENIAGITLSSERERALTRAFANDIDCLQEATGIELCFWWPRFSDVPLDA